MPSDIVSIAASTGLGVSVLAGILSGVCYILTQKLPKSRRNRKTRREWYCDVCGTYLRSIDGILEGEKVVTCAKCQARVCKSRCCKLNDATEWVCKNCLNTPESWYQGILNVLQLNKTVELAHTMNKDSMNELDEDIEALRQKERERVRDFIEQLVNTLIGGNVDDAKVTKTYSDKQYLPSQGQSPCTAHAALKQLIQRLIQESLSLPLLRKVQDHPANPEEETNSTYEDLLATAIINKVISSAQNRLPNSSTASVSSRISSSSRREEKEYFFGDETLDNKWKSTDNETTSFSSVDDWLQSDSSFGSKKYVDRETLTIKHDIEVSHTDSEEDDNEYFRSRSSLLGDDEPNWFLQKRHFQTASPVPVPMLVPKPTNDAKVLIGDKEIDDTSDLSDIASDYGETEIVPGTQSILLESKTIIGGKNALHNGSDGESSADSGVKEVDRDRSGYDEPDFVKKADISVDDDNVEDASIHSVYSNTEKEAEYTERYASLPRQILKTPTPSSRPSPSKADQNGVMPNLESSVEKPKIESNVYTIEETNVNKISYIRDNDDILADTDSNFEGSYSKKEKEKWKHAVEMKNNPYSKENIEKRISRTKSPFGTLFGADYYARQASSPSGGKLKNSEVQWISQKFEGKKNEKSWVVTDAAPSLNTIENRTIENNEKNLSNDTHPIKTESSLELSISDMTSDSDFSYINYYDVENSQVYKKPTDDKTKTEKLLIEEVANHNQNNHTFIKTNTVTTKHKYHKTATNDTMKRRHKSESDLVLEDSFDTPPKVLGKKKDNTLISKIYSQPHVRNFALSSRKQNPLDVTSPTSPTSIFIETGRYNGKLPLYNSESEMQQDQRSFNSSTEDLIEPSQKTRIFTRSTSAFVTGHGPRKTSVSSEDDVLSEHSSNIGFTVKRNSRHHIYSSSDDLFSIEEPEKPQKKKDNTLIDKIYQNPQVRNFALASRDFIPTQGDNSPLKKTFSSEDETPDSKIFPTHRENIPSTPSKQSNKIGKSTYTGNYELVIEVNTRKSNDETHERDISSPDPDIDEIAKRKIVHNLIDKFATSQPEVAPRKNPHSDNLESIDSDNEIYVSVRELRKKFENNNGKSDVKSSLTARSLSKKVREPLKY